MCCGVHLSASFYNPGGMAVLGDMSPPLSPLAPPAGRGAQEFGNTPLSQVTVASHLVGAVIVTRLKGVLPK